MALEKHNDIRFLEMIFRVFRRLNQRVLRVQIILNNLRPLKLLIHLLISKLQDS